VSAGDANRGPASSPSVSSNPMALEGRLRTPAAPARWMATSVGSDVPRQGRDGGGRSAGVWLEAVGVPAVEVVWGGG
jgi:hypothetical protein